jgi:curved DNA-binding protein
MQFKDYYEVLGIDRKASQDDIKHAYRRMARKFHPDVSKEPQAEEKFKNVQEAYEVLKDPEKRAAYDQLGSNWKQGQEFRPPPDWGRSTHFGTGHTEGFSEENLGGFSDFFANLFGQARSRSRGEDFAGFKQRGHDQHAKINITLEEAYHGATKMLQMQIPEIDASGQIQQSLRTIKVMIPPGAIQGQQLRLAKQGGSGLGGADAGDLYLEIEIQPHPVFSLKGHDVYLTLPVTPWEAALGADIKIPTLGGRVGLKVSPGSQTGQQLRLKGRGLPSKTKIGDQYAILQIYTPPAHNEEQRKLYENMAQVIPYNPRKWSS